MFHLEKHRHQLIIEVRLPNEAMKAYVQAKKAEPAATFELTTVEDIDLASLVKEKKPFSAKITKRGLESAPLPCLSISSANLNRTPIVPTLTVQTTSIIKDKSLKGRYRDTSYPTNFFPFYLYGTPQSLNIDHILSRSPNIQLSAEDINLSLEAGASLSISASVASGFSTSASLLTGHLPADALAKGLIVTIDNISEAAMQPFQSTEGPLSDTLITENPIFFFRPGQESAVTVYEDPKAWNEPGPGLLDAISSGKAKVLGKGKMMLREGRYVDSVQINADPFEIPEGTEKFKKWKKVFDSIGKELE